MGHAYIGNTEPFHLEKDDALVRCSSTRMTIGGREWPLTIAGVAQARVVAVDAGTGTSHELRDVYIGGGHRVVGVCDALDMLDRVYEGDCDGGRCGG